MCHVLYGHDLIRFSQHTSEVGQIIMRIAQIIMRIAQMQIQAQRGRGT